MAVKLNLLPSDYALIGPMGQIIKIIRPLNVILLGLFFVMGIGIGGFFVFSSISLQSLNSTNNALKTKIRTQETAQQQMVLLKDRLGYIKTIESLPTAIKNLANMSNILSSVGTNTIISELNIDPQKTSSSVIFKTNSDLVSFINNLKNSKNFATITLGSFTYNPGGGYLVALDFKAK